jgi:glycosyltransferase involved in cell wall biosynthesis
MKKHIIITKLYEFGGGNTHLKALINYFGKENVILVVESKEQLIYLKNIIQKDPIKTRVLSKIHGYAHLSYLFTTNIKELFFIIRSLISVFLLSVKHGFADVTVSATEPEKHLYLLWLPFIKVTYILHTTPPKKYTWFTSWTCLHTLGRQKKIITVSNANKTIICTNWDITDRKKEFVYVIYNCISEINLNESNMEIKSLNKNFIVTMGHVTEYKNPSVWLEVAKQVTSVRKDIHFIWLGNGPLWSDFRDATLETKRITFQGSVTDPETYLKNALIYYQPSLQETHGIAVVEAMYNNLPCVVANIGGLPESVQSNQNGILVDPHNIQENINAIIYLLDNDKMRSTYSSNSYLRYQELFTFSIFKTKMNLVYNN